MMQRGKVVALREQVFIVPHRHWTGSLAEQLPYKLVEMMNQDDVAQTLRNNLAHPV